MKKHPIQRLLENQGIKTFSYNGRIPGEPHEYTQKCLGAYCTLGGLLRVVSCASGWFIDTCDIEKFQLDIAEAKTFGSGRLFYWPGVKYVENVDVTSSFI